MQIKFLPFAVWQLQIKGTDIFEGTDKKIGLLFSVYFLNMTFKPSNSCRYLVFEVTF